MAEFLFIFEIIMGIAFVAFGILILIGLLANQCWIFDSDYWIDARNSRVYKILEKRINDLERRIEELEDK